MIYVLKTDNPCLKKDIKHLKKKFRRINEDLRAAVSEIVKSPRSNDALPGFDKTVYKSRHAIKTENIGALGGLRIVYLIDGSGITLLRVYFKGEKEDITPDEIKHALKSF
jgi:hypothetical protein